MITAVDNSSEEKYVESSISNQLKSSCEIEETVFLTVSDTTVDHFVGIHR